MIKFALAHHPGIRHTLVYSNKMWADVIFRDDLEKLATANPGRLAITHSLTREENPAAFGPNVRKGRIGLPLLREMIPEPDACYVYVCGPGISKFDIAAAKEAGTVPQPRFLETVLADLKTLGVPNERIRREFYG